MAIERKKIVNYVKKRNKNLPEYNFGHLHVVIKDPIKNDVDLKSLAKVLKDK